MMTTMTTMMIKVSRNHVSGSTLESLRYPALAGMKPVSGFSLVELLIAVALSLFLMAGLQLTYISGRTASQEAEVLSRMQENIRFASDYLVRDVRNAGYRDLLALTFEQDAIIGRAYAEYGEDDDTSELIVRYAGRGACGRVFEATGLKVIENRYFVNDRGELVCEGTEIDAEGEATTAPPFPLASGLRRVNFGFLFADGIVPTTVCDFHEEDDLFSACLGVRMVLQFDDEQARSAQLIASFRNVIVDRVYGRQ